MTKQEGRTTSTGATDGGGESADAAVNADGLRFERDTVEPRIYLASLTDYNAGILHGRWVEVWWSRTKQVPLQPSA